MSSSSEIEYLLRRAEEEAILAIRTRQASAEAVHYELSLRYSVKAQQALSDTRSAFRFGPVDPK